MKLVRSSRPAVGCGVRVCVRACERYVCMDVCVRKCVKNVCGLDIECYTSETVRDFRGCPMILCTVYSTRNVRA